MGIARFNTWLLSSFAVIALALAAMGVYALVSYSVAIRTPEIGLRMALGAQPRDVERLLVAKGLRLAALGLGIGAAAALGATRVLGAVHYEVPVRDPVSLVMAVAVLGTAVVLASWLPARRAARIPPTDALRHAE
jgi:ABC-type antimicrobial peptide transport system permease subunit